MSLTSNMIELRADDKDFLAWYEAEIQLGNVRAMTQGALKALLQTAWLNGAYKADRNRRQP